MLDIETDSLPQAAYTRHQGLCIGDHLTSQHSLIGMTGHTWTRDSSQQLYQPTDSLVITGRTGFSGTNGSASNAGYRNSQNLSNNLLSTLSQNQNERNTFDTGHNFSYRNNSSGNLTSNDTGYNFSYRNNASDNRTTSDNQVVNASNESTLQQNSATGLPNIDHLLLTETDSAFVFNRPQSDVRTSSNQRNKQIVLQNSKYPDFKDIMQRIQSFVHSTALVRNPRVMSEAGFFAIRDQDFVRCFHCGIGLRNWEDDDDPYVEHCRWSSNCQYMKNKKGQAFVDAVQEAVRKVQLEEALEQSDTRVVESDGDVMYPDLATDSDNKESYPASVLKKNPLLSNAAQAVIEMGYLPRIVKKALDVLMKDSGLEGLTAERIANLVIDMESKGEKVMIPNQSTSEARQKKLQMTAASRKELEEENREYKEKILCVICCEAQRSITFLPCGHLVCCAQCAPACNSCAVCRKEIKGTVKISLA